MGYTSKTNRPPIGLHRLSKYMRTKEGKTAVIVGKVTDDVRMLDDIPKISVCALGFTESVKKRIIAAGGECITFDQLALRSPKGTNTVLLRGPKDREALSHFGHSTSVNNPHTQFSQTVCSIKRKKIREGSWSSSFMWFQSLR